MKRFIAIFLLALILIYTVGYIGIYMLSAYHIKQDMKALIKKYVPNDKLLCISVDPSNAAQLSWKEKGKEFRYKGKMYDVVRSETTAGSINYYCMTDERETELMATLETYCNDNSAPIGASRKGKTASLLKEFDGSMYTLKPAHKITCPVFKSRSYCDISMDIALVDLDIASPPPKQGFAV